MNDESLEMITKLYEEFVQFKSEINERIKELNSREENDYRVFEDIAGKIDDLKNIIENHHYETIEEQKEILENLSEKIAMIMLRK